jgi:hypothetical protein
MLSKPVGDARIFEAANAAIVSSEYSRTQSTHIIYATRLGSSVRDLPDSEHTGRGQHFWPILDVTFGYLVAISLRA